MPKEKKDECVVVSLGKKTMKFLTDLSKSSDQNEGSTVRLAIMLLHYLCIKVTEGYEVQLVNKKTEHVIVIPMV